MEVVKYIEGLLRYTVNNYYQRIYNEAWRITSVGGFFVHSSIFETFKNLPELTTEIQNVWDYELQIGETSYSVKLVFVRDNNALKFTFIRDLIQLTDISFSWERNLALYVPIQYSTVLEKFIEIENLHQFIDSIKVQQGIIDTNEMIRVVRFAIRSETEKLDFILKFGEFYYKQNLPHYTTSFYIRIAFPWLQLWVLEKFDVPFEIDHQFYQSILITLQHTNHLSNNIFDLVALRMALCDFRNLKSTMFVQSEIDRVIVGTMRDPKYSINGGFYLELYKYDKNITSNERIDWLESYFIYTFQDFLRSGEGDNNSEQTIELCNNRDVLNVFNMLTLKSNLKFLIDGRKFDAMSFKLFNDLAGCHNVTNIKLDTNYRLDNNMDGIDGLKFLNKHTVVILSGSNPDGFIEEFVLCCKKHSVNRNLFLSLLIDCELRSYLIFDNFPICLLGFRDITITTTMMTDFSNCSNFISKIHLHNCEFENKPANWMLLLNFEHLNEASIREDMNTWQSMFDAVAEMLRTSKRTELKITRNINIISERTIALKKRIFVLVEDGTKLELRHPTSYFKDIYCFKSGLELDDRNDYDFYQ